MQGQQGTCAGQEEVAKLPMTWPLSLSRERRRLWLLTPFSEDGPAPHSRSDAGWTARCEPGGGHRRSLPPSAGDHCRLQYKIAVTCTIHTALWLRGIFTCCLCKRTCLLADSSKQVANLKSCIRE